MDLTVESSLIVADALDDLATLTNSPPLGDAEATERTLLALRSLLPTGARIARTTSSTAGCTDDLLASVAGTGEGRLLLLCHADQRGEATGQQLRVSGAAVHGPGMWDSKGGLLLASGTMRALVREPAQFSSITLLAVGDRHRRTRGLETSKLASYDACMAFSAATTPEPLSVITRRRMEATLSIEAHLNTPGSDGSALLALGTLAKRLDTHIIDGPETIDLLPHQLTAQVGSGKLTCDLRAFSGYAAHSLAQHLVPETLNGAAFRTVVDERYPPMDDGEASLDVVARAGELLGGPLTVVSALDPGDVNSLAALVPVCFDGLGAVGGRAGGGIEYVELASLNSRARTALALATAALGG